MSMIGSVLASQLVEYLRYRSAATGSIRLFLTDYPSDVLEDACRELVRQAESRSGDLLRFGHGVTAVIALIQSGDDAEAGRLSTENGYPIGVSPDFPVSLRNRRGNVVVACPPDLIHLCHESIKTNSFQYFLENRKFGSRLRLFRRIAALLDGDEASAGRKADVLSTLYRHETRRRGVQGQLRFYSQLEGLLAQTAASQTGVSDWRLLGLLPQERLRTALGAVDGTTKRIETAVAENLSFQARLVAGLASEQSRYLKSFEGREGGEALHDFLVARAYRLDPDDPSWRQEWPETLIIDRFQSQRPAGSAKVSGLRVTSAQQVLGIPVVGPRLSATWRTTPRALHSPGHLSISDGSRFDIDDVAVRALDADPSGIRPGVWHASIDVDDPGVSPPAEAPIIVGGDEPVLLARVDSSAAGSPSYAVDVRTSFRLEWELYPPIPADLFLLSVPLGGEDDRSLVQLPGAQSAFDIAGGVDREVEIELLALAADGSTIAATTLRIVPESVGQERTAGSIAMALLATAEAMEPSTARPRGRVETELSDDAVEIRLTGDEAANTWRYSLRSTSLLADCERALLDEPADPRPLRLRLHDERRSNRWVPERADGTALVEPQGLGELWASYIAARRQVLSRLSQLGGTARACLVELQAEIERYADAYRQLLFGRFPDERRVERQGVLILLTDSVLVSYDSGRQPGSTASPALILVSPTHPLRLAWLLQYELLVRRLFEDSKPWTSSALRTVNSTFFPASLVDWNLAHYHASTTAESGRWSVLLPEGRAEIDALVPAGLSRQLNLESPRDTVATTPQQLALAVAQFHDLHPHRDALRLSFANPGTGEKILEALRLLIEQKGAGQRRDVLSRLLAEKTVFDLGLLDIYDDEPDWSTGNAFGDYSRDEDADLSLTSRVRFGVERRKVTEAADALTPLSEPTHVLFGSSVFAVGGESIQIPSGDPPPGLSGTLLPLRREFESGDVARVVVSALVSRPPGWGRDGAGSLERSLHEITFGLQSIAAATTDRPTSSPTHGRALVTRIEPGKHRLLEWMHENADWVYLADANVDVEYFDQPKLGGKFIIDYVPRLLAGGVAGQRHNYVITTSHDHLLLAAINRFLYTAFPSARDVPEGAARVLSHALNRVTGRLLLALVSDPSRARGAVGMGLLQLLYQSLSLLTPLSASMRVLIPIDDYVGAWNQELDALEGRGDRDRADIADVLLTLQEDGSVVLTVQLIEIKNVRQSYSAGDLRARPVRQIANSSRVLDLVYGWREPRADQAVKDAEFARLIDFHLRRTAMQQLGDQPESLARTREFRRVVASALLGHRYEVRRRLSAGSDLDGVVAHFNVEVPSAAASIGPTPVRGDAAVLYLLFGLPDIQRLLTGQPPLGEADLRGWLGMDTMETTLPGTSEGAGIDESAQPPVGEPHVAPQGVELQPVRIRGGDEARLAFEGFIGNEAAIRRLLPWVAVAVREQPPRLAENIAFTGPPSTGKTELARRIAGALRIPFLPLSGSALRSLDDLLTRMRQKVEEEEAVVPQVGMEGGVPVLEFPPIVVFIDEAHEIRRAVQEAMLTLLEPMDRRAAGTPFVADARHVTFILATTEWGDLLGTIQSRLQRIPLESYSLAQVAEMVHSRHSDWAPAICERLALAGRQVPRVALQRAKEFANALEAYGNVDPDVTLDEYFQLWGVDSLGIDENDRLYMSILDQAASPMGLDRVANAMRAGEREIAQTIEPYLQSKGLVEVTNRGRTLTDAGKAYLRQRPRG